MNKTTCAIHVTDNWNGTMTARSMLDADNAPATFEATNYLTAAECYLAARWPALTFRKTGWSANISQAIYHFDSI